VQAPTRAVGNKLMVKARIGRSLSASCDRFTQTLGEWETRREALAEWSMAKRKCRSRRNVRTSENLDSPLPRCLTPADHHRCAPPTVQGDSTSTSPHRPPTRSQPLFTLHPRSRVPPSIFTAPVPIALQSHAFPAGHTRSWPTLNTPASQSLLPLARRLLSPGL
jgi:hypothetical protein